MIDQDRIDDLINRLRGKYKIGVDGEFGERDFSGFIPPISIEAADLITELQAQLKETERLRVKSRDFLAVANASCKRRGLKIKELQAKLSSTNRVVEAAENMIEAQKIWNDIATKSLPVFFKTGEW